MSALDTQVGGGHYNEMGVQPLEATYLNYGYVGLEAAVFCKVSKYIQREKDTKVVNINKAIHCLEVLRDAAEETFK
jgi:hypothetical protein